MDVQRSFAEVQVGDQVRVFHQHLQTDVEGPVFAKLTDEGIDYLILGTAQDQSSADIPSGETVTVILPD